MKSIYNWPFPARHMARHIVLCAHTINSKFGATPNDTARS